jgi:hypothetical protein
MHGIARDERALVIVFLKRYVSWCAKGAAPLCHAVDLLVEVAAR